MWRSSSKGRPPRPPWAGRCRRVLVIVITRTCLGYCVLGTSLAHRLSIDSARGVNAHVAFVHGRREAQRVSAACQTGRRVERRGAPSRSEAFPPDPEGRPWPSGQPEALSAFTRGPVWDGRPPRAIKASAENSRQARPKHRAPRWPGREATSPLAAPPESREQDAVGRRARSGPSFLPLRPPVRAWAWRRARAKQVCAATRGHTGLASVPRAGPWPRPDSAPAARVVPLTHMAACVRARVCAGSRLVTDVHALRPLGQGQQGVRGGRGV